MAPMKSWSRLAVLSSFVIGAWAQAAAAQTVAPPPKSALDAVLFYQILLGELSAREGSAGSGFSIILDAARKTRDPALFQRAVDMALQARSGDAALQAAQSWKKEIPGATEATRYMLQILLALNRVEEAGKALGARIQELPQEKQSEAITSVPRLFEKVQDKKLAAEVVEKALAKQLDQKLTAAATWTTVGRLRREAGQMTRAVDAVIKGHAADPSAMGPLVLAVSLLASDPARLKPLLNAAMATDLSPELRQGYARTLLSLQMVPEALAQLAQLNDKHPNFAEAWLIHGLVLHENAQPQKAEKCLEEYVRLVSPSDAKDQQAGLTEALLTLSEIAQSKKQLERAKNWLSQIPEGVDPIKLASRQAELLTSQGQLDQARQVLAQIKTTSPEQALRKVLVQSVWLRENQQAQAAYTLVKEALNKAQDDAQLISELAMVCEKLKRHDEMERLLRMLMAKAPEDAHAYNALGYSLADRNTRLDEASVLIDKAVQLSPKDPYIQDSLGWLRFRQGQWPEALRILQAAYKAKPDAEIAAHLGEVLWLTGQTDAAATVWREGLLLKADNETLLSTLQRLNFKP